MTDKVCIRKSDGAFFEPSCRDGYGEGQALADLFSGRHTWYFRRIELRPRRFLPFIRKWVRTGETWEPSSGEFDVLSEKDARKRALK